MNLATAVKPDSRQDLHYLSLTDLSDLIRRRTVSPVEVAEAMLARIDALDGDLKSYMTVLPDHAMAAARKAEAELAAGLWRGPLHGVPIAVKDLCETTYAPTSAGMKINADYMAARDSTVVARLDAAGAVMLGKLVLTEGAMSGHHPDLRTPVNPWDPAAWTGASSSGSGVATAAGLCFGSLGSDTGGSIRFPSAACGLTGVKPTWGRVSRAGVFALADSLDHVGPMTRTVADAAAMLAVIAGADPRDPTALVDPVPDYPGSLGGSIAGVRVGIDESYVFDRADETVAATMREVIEVLTGLGAVMVPVRMPDMGGMVEAWMNLCCSECAVAHRETFPARRDEYGPVLSGVIDHGLSCTPLDVAAAVQYRLKLVGAIRAAMTGVDLMLAPASATAIMDAADWNAPIGEQPEGAMDLALRFTAPFDFSGQPTLSMNGGFDARGVPVGFQLIGHHLGEAAMLGAGHAFQSVTDWHTRHPEL